MCPVVYVCEQCGPGPNKYKSSECYYIINKDTGNVYCLVHKEHKIGSIQEARHDN
jgi:hypothetical protein